MTAARTESIKISQRLTMNVAVESERDTDRPPFFNKEEQRKYSSKKIVSDFCLLCIRLWQLPVAAMQ